MDVYLLCPFFIKLHTLDVKRSWYLFATKTLRKISNSSSAVLSVHIFRAHSQPTKGRMIMPIFSSSQSKLDETFAPSSFLFLFSIPDWFTSLSRLWCLFHLKWSNCDALTWLRNAENEPVHRLTLFSMCSVRLFGHLWPVLDGGTRNWIKSLPNLFNYQISTEPRHKNTLHWSTLSVFYFTLTGQAEKRNGLSDYSHVFNVFPR